MAILDTLTRGRSLARRALPYGRAEVSVNLDLASTLIAADMEDFKKKWSFDPVGGLPLRCGRHGGWKNRPTSRTVPPKVWKTLRKIPPKAWKTSRTIPPTAWKNSKSSLQPWKSPHYAWKACTVSTSLKELQHGRQTSSQDRMKLNAELPEKFDRTPGNVCSIPENVMSAAATPSATSGTHVPAAHTTVTRHNNDNKRRRSSSGRQEVKLRQTSITDFARPDKRTLPRLRQDPRHPSSNHSYRLTQAGQLQVTTCVSANDKPEYSARLIRSCQ